MSILYIEEFMPALPNGKTPPKAVSGAYKQALDIVKAHNAKADQCGEDVRDIEAKSPVALGIVEADMIRTAKISTLQSRANSLEQLREPISVVVEWVGGLQEANVQEAIDAVAQQLIGLGWTLRRGGSGEWLPGTDEQGRVSGPAVNGVIRTHPSVYDVVGTNSELRSAKDLWRNVPGKLERLVKDTQAAFEAHHVAVLGLATV